MEKTRAVPAGRGCSEALKIRAGLPSPLFRKSSRIIDSKPAATRPHGNPYRAILRREYPEPLIALLAFILGIWLWDHYFGENEGYPPGTEGIALVKIDRDLRLADAMEDDAAWLRWLAGVDRAEAVRLGALEVLAKLAAERAISPQGLEAYAILRAEQENVAIPVDAGGLDFEEVSREMIGHRGTWWQVKWLEARVADEPAAALGRQVYLEDSRRLRTRAVAARGAVWLLGAVGLAFVPAALGCLRRGLSARPAGYGGGWTISLGLVIFLVATLAWIGFSLTLDIGIGLLPGLHPVGVLALDSAARILPALIALALLFRRPGHVVRVMGLAGPLAWRPILGLFALLMIGDQILQLVFLGSGTDEPGGGLSGGDSGWWGLVFALVSACLLAPVAEEVLYRGVLFRSCRNRLGVIPAAAVSAAVFAVLHFYDGYGLASVAVFGLACAFLYSGSGSLAAAIALHMLYNTSIKLPEWIVYHAPLG